MASLSDHLRASGSDGRLPFHRGCPICREERLSGNLTADTLLTQRGRGAVLLATLAASSLAMPSVALAERVTGGTGHAAQVSDGELDRINADDGTHADSPAAEDDAPLDDWDLIEPDPQEGREEPPPSPGSEVPLEQGGDGDEPVEPEPESAPSPDPEPVHPAPAAPPATPSPAAPPGRGVALSDQQAVDHSSPTIRQLRLELQGGQGDRAGEAVTNPPGSVSGEAAPAVGGVGPTTSTAVSASVRNESPAVRDSSQRQALVRGRSYTVRTGDSLWSIAQRLIGRDVSVARIADEVNRLWDLNRDRIATGDPDLLPVGTELRL